ncbi:hypothetical protein J4Q44_G00007910 [Coregonus suidteri]|uniref:Uncharacterized protein n=1 Tax=Coregonus suidteri TaxID=861788 RepID=A0AAN8MEY5_9TELE
MQFNLNCFFLSSGSNWYVDPRYLDPRYLTHDPEFGDPPRSDMGEHTWLCGVCFGWPSRRPKEQRMTSTLLLPGP